MNQNHDYTITERSRRFRAKKGAEADRLVKLAREAHRRELAANREAKGLSPIKSGTVRAAESRARAAAAKAVVWTESWYSPPLRDWHEAKAYLMSVHPEVPEQVIENVLEETRRDSQKWELYWNRFVITNGIQAARVKRAILWQCWYQLDSEGDLDKLPQAIKDAEKQTEIQIDTTAHPTVQFRELTTALDFSQTRLGNGRDVRRAELDSK